MSSSPRRLLSEVRQAQLPERDRRREIRKAAGVTRQEMATALGVSPAAIYKWETESDPRTKAKAKAYRRLLEDLAALSDEATA